MTTKIQIPKTFMGEPIEGASERYFAQQKKGSVSPSPSLPQIITPAKNLTDPENYLILPGKTHGSYSYPDMLVAQDRSYLGKNWNDCHAELHKENFSMLTIRQFVDFLAELKSGKVYNGQGTKIGQTQINTLLEDILTQRNPYRTEWLDADFKVVNNVLHINYGHKFDQNNQLKPKYSEPLETCLMSDKTPGIDLEHWLKKATRQGLPPTNNLDGALYYWFPRSNNNSVAGFRALSGGVVLNCSRVPTGSDSGLGVRRAREK